MRKILLLILVVGCTLCTVMAQLSISERQQRTQEAKTAGGEQLEKYKAELLAALKGNDEQVYYEVAQAFYDLGMEKTMDSIWLLVRKKFPRGKYARSISLNMIYDEKDLLKKEKIYRAWLKRFPMEKLGEDIEYDYARYAVGLAWAEAGQVDKAVAYAKTLTSKEWRGEGYYGIARALEQNGHIEEAAGLYKMAMENAESLQKENGPEARFAVVGYPAYLSAYADVCYRLGHKAEALAAMEKLPADQHTVAYAEVMADAGRPMEAFLCLLDMVRGGNFNADLLVKLRELYVKINTTDKGFDAYIGRLRSVRSEEIRQKVAKEMICEPAPDFLLTDTGGKMVKLSDLRGKVVVLDFWATWCSPCKRSFPGMQKAVEKYRDDPNVEFLFIHTWERDENATETAMKYLKDNHYTFRLLMDLKDLEMQANPVVKNYGVTGIPTKFIIDPKGNIRFKVTGSPGNVDELIAELSYMIEMAR